MRFTFEFRSLATLCCLSFFLLVALGFWQIQRAEEKRAQLAQWQQRMALLPVSPPALEREGKDVHHRAVQLQGRYDARHVWYLDNRHYRGRVGFEVIQLFALSGGGHVLVNRGWRAARPDRRLFSVETPAGELNLTGRAYRPPKGAFVLREDAYLDTWPHYIQSVNVADMARALGISAMYSFLVRLDAGQAGVRPAHWPLTAVQPARHLGYAATWFALAAVLLLIVLVHFSREKNRASA